MVLADSGITRPRDLVGKTVGYPGIPSQEAFLATMLEDDGATMDDVDLVNIDFNLVPGLISGQVDASLGAFWTHEPILAEQEGYPTNFLKVDDWGVPPYYELVIAASEDTITERSQLVERFLRATRRGYEDAIADPAAAIAALRAASPDLNVAVEEAGIALLVPVWTVDDVPFGTQTAERWDDYAAWMAERGLIPDDLDVSAAWRGDLAPAIATPILPSAPLPVVCRAGRLDAQIAQRSEWRVLWPGSASLMRGHALDGSRRKCLRSGASRLRGPAPGPPAWQASSRLRPC